MTTHANWKTYGLTMLGIAAGAIIGIGADRLVLAQQTGIKRTPLITVDEPGAPTYEAVMGIAEIPPGGASGRHRHPGVEIGYVLDGSVQVDQQGKPTQILKAGQAFRIDAAAPHESKASGGAVKILTVHMVEKGKPLAEPVQ